VDEGLAFCGVLKAAVDLFADVDGKPRGFAIASHNLMLLFRFEGLWN
jgi:hypothetical protein